MGLGKTIQAGLLLRQAWLAGRAKRILVLAPKALLKQWQIELREKFNLNWPIYDGRKLSRYPAHALRGRHEREVDPRRWHEEPAVIASSHLVRRKDRAAVLLDAEPWDLNRPRRGAPRPPACRREPAGGRPERAAQADARPQGAHAGTGSC